MSETIDTPTNEPAKNTKSSLPWTALATIFAAIITCTGAIVVAALNPDLARLFFNKTPLPSSVPIEIPTQTPDPSTSPRPSLVTNTPKPAHTEIDQFSPGKDWLQGCICEQWIVYPSSEVPTEGSCYTEPIPGSIFTSNNSLIIRAEPDVSTAEEYGIFTRVPQSGTIRVHVDLDLLNNAEIWIGIFSEPDIESDGILMVVPYYEPTDSPGSDTRKRAFALRHMQMPLENRIYLSKEFEDPDGVYEIGFDLTSGTVAGFMENEITDDIPFSYIDRWLFIGYRALIRRSNIDILFKDLKITGY